MSLDAIWMRYTDQCINSALHHGEVNYCNVPIIRIHYFAFFINAISNGVVLMVERCRTPRGLIQLPPSCLAFFVKMKHIVKLLPDKPVGVKAVHPSAAGSVINAQRSHFLPQTFSWENEVVNCALPKSEKVGFQSEVGFFQNFRARTSWLCDSGQKDESAGDYQRLNATERSSSWFSLTWFIILIVVLRLPLRREDCFWLERGA